MSDFNMADLPRKQVQAQPPPTTGAGNPEIEDAAERQEEARTIRYAIGKLNEFLQWFIAVLEVMLLVRFCLKLIGAVPANLFAGFVYALTDIILFPFVGIVPSSTAGRLEWQVLIAIIIYWLLFWAIRRFLRILVSNPEEQAG